MALTRMGKLSVAGVVIGLVLIVFGVIIDHMPGIMMKKGMPIVDRASSKSFPGWSKPSLPIYMKFHFFNVTNVDAVMQGAKPLVQEVGPYVYLEQREKVNISFNDDQTEVSYREKISYYFDASMSVGSDADDVVSNYNLPFIGTVAALQQAKRDGNKKAGLAILLLNGKVAANGITLFTFNSVKELLWGHTSAFFNVVYRNARFKEKITTNQWGLFYGQNGTAGDLTTIGTGINDLDDIGQVKAYKGNSSLDYWYTDFANAINGTDGSMFHPGVDKRQNLYMFSKDLCRSILAEFKGEEIIQGVKTYHFGPAASVFAGPEENPDNAAFCWPDGNASSCLGKGLLRVSACKKSAPLVASSPHLLNANPAKVAMVEGLHPDPDGHVTKLNIEPNTGLLIAAKKRIQYNVLVDRVPRQGIFKKITDQIVLPLFWVEESMEAPPQFAAKLSRVPKLVATCRNLMLAFVALGAMLVLGCLLVVLGTRDRLFIPSAPKPAETSSAEEDKFENVKLQQNGVAEEKDR